MHFQFGIGVIGAEWINGLGNDTQSTAVQQQSTAKPVERCSKRDRWPVTYIDDTRRTRADRANALPREVKPQICHNCRSFENTRLTDAAPETTPLPTAPIPLLTAPMPLIDPWTIVPRRPYSSAEGGRASQLSDQSTQRRGSRSFSDISGSFGVFFQFSGILLVALSIR